MAVGAMEFRLLGALEVLADGRAVTITAARQEIVLSLLMLDANHVVSVSRMIEAVWDGDPPATARSQIQITISALRQLIGDDQILTRPPGYLLAVDDDAVDITGFEMSAARAAEAAAGARTAEAVRLLRSALGRWRGPALDGVGGEVVRAAATRLNERRVSVWHDCIDHELQLGGHREVIGELMELVAAYPLDERFREQLMLALYRSGRSADALETFRAGRRILQEELGLDPGPALRRMERAILASDDWLDARDPGQHAPDPAGVPVPCQLPRTVGDFTGREDVVAQLATVIGAVTGASGGADVAVPVAVLTGRGGIGKTALAVHAAHVLRSAFPDGQLFLQLHSDLPGGVSGLLGHLLPSLGIRPDAIPEDLAGRAAIYRSWLADRRVLVVIDGAAGAGQVAPLLPATAGCAAIVTSAQRMSALAGAHQIELGPLDEQAGFCLLTTLVGDRRVMAEEAAARELVTLCEGLPLALRIVAAKLTERPHRRIGQLQRQLRDEGRRLDELDSDGTSVRATLALAYDSLDSPSREALRRLALLGTGSFASWVMSPLTDRDMTQAEGLLDSLVRAHLVEATVTADGTVRFWLHDLVRIFAVERLVGEETDASRMAALDRLLHCWLSLAAAAHARIYGGGFGTPRGTAEHWPLALETVEELIAEPADWFRRERAGLVAAIYKASLLNLDEVCWELATTAATLFESGLYADDWRDTHAVALTAVRRAGNRRGEAALLYSLGTLELGASLPRARQHFDDALRIFAEIRDDQGWALALSGIAFTDRQQGDHDAALGRYGEAIAGFAAAADRAGEAHARKSMAQIYADRRDFGTAAELLDRALATCLRLDAPRLTAQVQYELAELAARRGQYDAAAVHFEATMRWTSQAGDVIGEAYALAGLGAVSRQAGDRDAAARALTAALDLASQSGDKLIRGRVLIELAELDHDSGRHNLALARADEAIALLGELGSVRFWHARALDLLGRIHYQAGRDRVAEHAWRSALALASATDPGLAETLRTALGRLRSGDNQIDGPGWPQGSPTGGGTPMPSAVAD